MLCRCRSRGQRGTQSGDNGLHAQAGPLSLGIPWAAAPLMRKRHAFQWWLARKRRGGAGAGRSPARLDCTFAGTIAHERLPGMMSAADVFVLPALVKGHPKALVQAMSCGLTCVVSNCEGNRALIEHEGTGLLFDPTDVWEMAAQLERAFTDKAVASALGQEARQSILERYDLGELLELEVDLVKAAADRRML